MRILILLASIGSLFLSGTVYAACLTQQTSIIAKNGKLSICSDEPTTSIEIEKDGVVQPPIPMVLQPGVTTDLTNFVSCANTSLRVRGINAAGTSPWSVAIASTFPNCLPPKLVTVP